MGPLSGVRVIEVAGIGPAPFACMSVSYTHLTLPTTPYV